MCFFRNGVEQSLPVYAALNYACSVASFLRHRDSFHGVWPAEDLDEQFPSILASLGVEEDGTGYNTTSPVVDSDGADFSAENWEKFHKIDI